MFIDQKISYGGNFGEVTRSSAIFYYRRRGDFTTTVSFANYWKLKRGLDVKITASVRDMAGNLLLREELSFAEGNVVNYRPKVSGEGSIEIEVFSPENLVFPYPAIVGVYESALSVSMVHSYARAYSRREVQEGRTIDRGEEACWSVRDGAFAIFHNGAEAVAPQLATLRVGPREAAIPLGALAPYQTVKLRPSDYIDGHGQASLSFRLGQGFTRMLVGHETGGEFQVTHSNFNYSRHVSDSLGDGEPAYFFVPRLGTSEKSVVIYPDSAPGEYEVSGRRFRSGETVVFPFERGLLTFKRLDGSLPSRIVTGLRGATWECSLGVATAARPRKRFWWGICGVRSRLVVHDLPELYGAIPADTAITVTVLAKSSHAVLERRMTASDLPALEDGIPFPELFPELERFLEGDFGYFTFFSPHGGFFCYSTLERSGGAMTIEHAF